MDDFEIDVAIVGAGAVGLACLEAITRRHPSASVLLFERHAKFGHETSSHNSEVIHAGLYYSGLPLKAQHCRAGRDLLYAYCRAHGVPHARTGKWIVGTEVEQEAGLAKIERAARESNVTLERADPARLRALLDNPAVRAGLFSPDTGIVDSHVFMRSLIALSEARGAQILYRHRFVAFESDRALVVEGPDGARTRVRTQAFVNAAGLAADRVAHAAGTAVGYEIRPCRGRYFKLASHWTKRFAELVYPLPDPRGGLGVHLTFDLQGLCRLGPDVDWSHPGPADAPGLYVFERDAALDELQARFLEAGRRLFPRLRAEELSPDYVGVRPKLFREGQAHPDFFIHRGPRNDWHLLGIESPGLTAALSIAREVAEGLSL